MQSSQIPVNQFTYLVRIVLLAQYSQWLSKLAHFGYPHCFILIIVNKGTSIRTMIMLYYYHNLCFYAYPLCYKQEQHSNNMFCEWKYGVTLKRLPHWRIYLILISQEFINIEITCTENRYLLSFKCLFGGWDRTWDRTCDTWRPVIQNRYVIATFFVIVYRSILKNIHYYYQISPTARHRPLRIGKVFLQY